MCWSTCRCQEDRGTSWDSINNPIHPVHPINPTLQLYPAPLIHRHRYSLLHISSSCPFLRIIYFFALFIACYFSGILQVNPRSSGACLAMHIRHNDVTADDRAWSGVDRTLAAHVYYSRNLTTTLGLRHIFLATDNLTVVEVAAKLYPEFKW